MKFPNKRDYIDNIDGYMEEVITTCLEAHKSLINDTLVNMTDGKITDEQQTRYFIGKQLFSDEPIYKLLRLTANYKNDAYKDQKEEILFSQLILLLSQILSLFVQIQKSILSSIFYLGIIVLILLVLLALYFMIICQRNL